MQRKHLTIPSLCLSLCLMLSFLPERSFAQLELRPLSTNPIVEKAFQQLSHQGKLQQGTKTNEILSLPFLDDFSNPEVYPNEKLWQGRSVFINNTYPFYPPTVGVATFDAFDERGWVYSQASLIGNSFESDTLTSQIIRLDSIFAPYPKALSPADSIYLSFYYQPGGGGGNLWDPSRRGFTPQEEDLLLVEFYNTELNIWLPAWVSNGQSLDSFCNNFSDNTVPVQNKHYFRHIMIPIVNEAFFTKSFQFRFRAKSSIDPHFLSGGGQWHIDYVYLDAGRTMTDTFLRDVAFVETDPSLLKNYQSVPFRQFKQEMLKDSRTAFVSNLYNNALSCKYQYTISNERGEIIYSQPSSGEANTNVFPFTSSGYASDPDISTFPMTYAFSDVQGAKADFRIQHTIKVDLQNDLISSNDTLAFEQNFGNEFAYDDGSSEAGIGLTYPGLMAYKFNLNEPDTLTAIRICFNHSYENINEVGFKLCVWNVDAGGNPKDILYKSPVTLPKIANNINVFGTYNLNKALLLPKGDFFVGIEQLNSTYLNFGFDQNRDARQHLYYYYLNRDNNTWEWINTIYYGALMLRPAFGESAVEVKNETPTHEMSKSFRIYPNPLKTSVLNLILPEQCDATHTQIRIFDLSGRCILQRNYQTQIDLQQTKAGLYTIELSDGKSGLSFYSKLIIVR